MGKPFMKQYGPAAEGDRQDHPATAGTACEAVEIGHRGSADLREPGPGSRPTLRVLRPAAMGLDTRARWRPLGRRQAQHDRPGLAPGQRAGRVGPRRRWRSSAKLMDDAAGCSRDRPGVGRGVADARRRAVHHHPAGPAGELPAGRREHALTREQRGGLRRLAPRGTDQHHPGAGRQRRSSTRADGLHPWVASSPRPSPAPSPAA